MVNQNEEIRPTALEIARVQEQLRQTPNDPDLALMPCNCIDLEELATGKMKSTEEHREICRNCSRYKDFAAKYPKHCPDYD